MRSATSSFPRDRASAFPNFRNSTPLFGIVTHMGVYDFRGRLKPMHILQNLLHGLSETAEFLAQGVIMPHSVRAEALT